MLGTENACSFQSLARYLSTDSHYLLQEARCREPSHEEDSDTVISFVVYCGQTYPTHAHVVSTFIILKGLHSRCVKAV